MRPVPLARRMPRAMERPVQRVEEVMALLPVASPPARRPMGLLKAPQERLFSPPVNPPRALPVSDPA